MRFGGREYKTPAHLGKEAVARVNTPYSHAFPRCKGCFCSLFEVGGAGREAPQKPTVNAVQVQTFLPRKEADEGGGQGLLIQFPVFGGEKAAAKIRTVKGLRVEIFSRCARKNTTRPLTVRIVGADEIFRLQGTKVIEIFAKLC